MALMALALAQPQVAGGFAVVAQRSLLRFLQ